MLRLLTQLFTFPGVWNHKRDKNGAGVVSKQAVFAASSGGRMIMTAKNCLRQIPHCDFPQPDRAYPEGSPHPEPSYFFMVAGGDGFYIYVWKESHREINHSPSVVEKKSSQNIPTAFWVPPYHVLIGRGRFTTRVPGGKTGSCRSNPASTVLACDIIST